jgi:hypothetical protein
VCLQKLLPPPAAASCTHGVSPHYCDCSTFESSRISGSKRPVLVPNSPRLSLLMQIAPLAAAQKAQPKYHLSQIRHVKSVGTRRATQQLLLQPLPHPPSPALDPIVHLVLQPQYALHANNTVACKMLQFHCVEKQFESTCPSLLQRSSIDLSRIRDIQELCRSWSMRVYAGTNSKQEHNACAAPACGRAGESSSS